MTGSSSLAPGKAISESVYNTYYDLFGQILLNNNMSPSLPTAPFLSSRALQANHLSNFSRVPYTEEILCYAIPYGTVGFANHLATYYTVILLAMGRRPLMPWRKLDHKILDSAYGVVSLAVTMGVSIYTIIGCQNTWEFMLIAVWKLLLSATTGVITIHAGHIAADYGRTSRVLWWLLLYLTGVVIGSVGLFAIVSQVLRYYSTLLVLTEVFAAVAGFLAIAIPMFIMMMTFEDKRDWLTLPLVIVLFVVLVIGVLFALYSDWALACIAQDWAGMTPGYKAELYWAYFAAKRLQMFAM